VSARKSEQPRPSVGCSGLLCVGSAATLQTYPGFPTGSWWVLLHMFCAEKSIVNPVLAPDVWSRPYTATFTFYWPMVWSIRKTRACDADSIACMNLVLNDFVDFPYLKGT